MAAMSPFFELWTSLDQQGPGGHASTARAFSSVKGRLGARPRILDMGCGTGRQTLALARLAPEATIEAVDPLQPFTDALKRRALDAAVADRIATRNTSMTDPCFAADPADLIWSEGAIYHVGVRAGLEAWKGFLKPGGCVAFSELSWLVDSPPAEARAFFAAEYPVMQTHEANLSLVRELGWTVLDHFALPDSDWLRGYYEPLEARHRELSEKYAHDPEALAALGDHATEVEMYRRHSDSYGYVFYVLAAERAMLGSNAIAG